MFWEAFSVAMERAKWERPVYGVVSLTLIMKDPLCVLFAFAVAMERAQWERPVDGGAISARGKLEAAKNQTQTQLAAMRTRGAVEEFIVNPELLEQGKVPCKPPLTDTRN